jgi:NAD-dependent dihydropyrimidine dehydrogenase PreA subunit
MPYIITEKCKDEVAVACVDVCPVDCIHPLDEFSIDDKTKIKAAGEQLYINPDDCIECGACAADARLRQFIRMMSYRLNLRRISSATLQRLAYKSIFERIF